MGFLLFILGLLPFAAGYGLTLVPKLMDGYMAYVTAAVFIILWFFIAKLGKLLCKKTFKTVGYLNLAGFIDLLIVAIQIFILQSFWNNQFGTWSALFFAPVRVLGIAIAQLLSTEYFQILIYVMSFCILLVVSFLGAVFTRTKKKDGAKKGGNDGSGLAALAKKAEESKANLESNKE